jgi:hypothetical protein
MTNSTQQIEYRISDLYFAAYLKAQGVPLVRAEAMDARRVSFVFMVEDDDEIPEMERAFLTGAETPAIAYANSVKDLKHLIGLTLKQPGGLSSLARR